MNELNGTLQRLAKRLSLTDPNPEPEPYLLTKEDEERLLKNAIEALKTQSRWKYTSLGFSAQDFDLIASGRDWSRLVDREKLFSAANSSKNHDLWLQDQRKKQQQEEVRKAKELQDFWDAKQFYRLMAWTSRNVYKKRLIVNENTSELIKVLCFFMSGDKRFETDFDPKLGYSLSKGLWLRGVSGLGKTHLVKCIADNPIRPVHIESMVEISEEITDFGMYEIDPGNKKMLYIDDVGSEEQSTIPFYGKKINFFKNFMEKSYLNLKSFNHLIVSTNNSFSEIQDRYGFRVRSRVKEMFNVIDVKGVDMR